MSALRESFFKLMTEQNQQPSILNSQTLLTLGIKCTFVIDGSADDSVEYDEAVSSSGGHQAPRGATGKRIDAGRR